LSSPWKPALVVLAAAAVTLTACGHSDDSGKTDDKSATGAPVKVVASTNVYGDIVEQIGGDKVSVTSLISDPDQDPHSYEADTHNQLAISKARLIIENGGGYDDFVDRMRKTAKNDPTVINVVKLSGKKAPAGGELNEHVWYDFPTVAKLAGVLATSLGAADPVDAKAFTANAAVFTRKLAPLEKQEAAVRKAHAGAGVAITEPVPLYLLDACGMRNLTPDKFSEAIEEGGDVPASVLQSTLHLFTDKKVKALVYNEQTSGAVTERVKKAANANGIAVVPVTETLPDGKDYLSWMQSNLDAITAAVGK
jgi:zinc/manganese transport system substrate-binding protein